MQIEGSDDGQWDDIQRKGACEGEGKSFMGGGGSGMKSVWGQKVL